MAVAAPPFPDLGYTGFPEICWFVESLPLMDTDRHSGLAESLQIVKLMN
jgi:hypothetical protein